MASPGRVLILDENLAVPLDRRVWMEANALRDAGYRVTVVCPVSNEYPARRETIEGIEILRHPLHVEASGPAGYLLEYSEALFWETMQGLALSRRQPIDVVHLCNPPDLLFIVGILMRRVAGAALIFDQHDVCPELFEAKFGVGGPLRRALLLAERASFACADVVISPNASYQEIAIGRGRKHPGDVFVVRNGPDPSRFALVAPRSEFKRGHRYLVGYIGQMGAQEGIDSLLLAARHIVSTLRRDDVAFCIMGGGPALRGLKALAHDLGLDSHVEFTGRIPDRELLERLSTCDIGVNPDPKNAFNELSTMNKVMEYMVLSKPVVQFDLKEGRKSAAGASLYARGNDPIDFANKILELLDNDDIRKRMGVIGRERVLSDLGWPQQVPRLLAAYSRALEIGAARRLRRAIGKGGTHR